jgi:uncharacterized membrane protein YheB (UPF0754 family)
MTFLYYLSIPLIGAFIGWVTNWMAVKMIFKPREPFKVGPLVFQGIIPKYQHKFAHSLATMATQELISARELFQKIEPEKVKEILKTTLDGLSHDYVKIAIDEVSPTVWGLLPQSTKNSIIEAVRAETLTTVTEIFKDLDDNIERRLDLYQFIYDKITGENVGLMETLFYRVSYDQLKFIEYSGAYFGFAIGLIQLLLWSVMQQWFIMPIVGFIVGIVTNWIAIKMCFEPREPTKYWFITYQGMVPRRQKEISKLFGEQAAEEILRPDYLVAKLLTGESGDRIIQLISNKIDAVIDSRMGLLKPMGVLLVGDKFRLVKEKIVRRAVSSFSEIAGELQYYIKTAIGVSEMLEIKLTGLPKSMFEEILRGLFKEDEMLLIMYGGVLGAIIGFIQAAMLLVG